jgi:hypothetical protein
LNSAINALIPHEPRNVSIVFSLRGILVNSTNLHDTKTYFCHNIVIRMSSIADKRTPWLAVLLNAPNEWSLGECLIIRLQQYARVSWGRAPELLNHIGF